MGKGRRRSPSSSPDLHRRRRTRSPPRKSKRDRSLEPGEVPNPEKIGRDNRFQNGNARQDVDQEDEYYSRRRTQREKITVELGAQYKVWGVSPDPKALKRALASPESDSSVDSLSSGGAKKRKKSSKKSKKHKKDKKKRKKNKKKRSGSESAGSGDEWIEITKETLNRKPEEIHVGPQLPGMETDEAGSSGLANQRVDYGKDLRPGEGAAIAAYIAAGMRIPRRGEIGLDTDDIEKFEQAGFVMSGSRHRRMEATRLRKENQIYTAEEKRMLANMSTEERAKRETRILSQFKQLIDQKKG